MRRVPSGIPQQCARKRVPRTSAKAPKRFGRPQGVEKLRGFALLLFPDRIGRQSGYACEQRFIGISVAHIRRRPDGRFRFWRLCLQLPVFFFDDIRKHEPVTVAGDCAHVARRARVVSKHPPDGANSLAQRAVGNDDVAPDAVEDVAAMYGFVPVFNQKYQQVEVARNEGLFPSVADEHAAARR